MDPDKRTELIQGTDPNPHPDLSKRIDLDKHLEPEQTADSLVAAWSALTGTDDDLSRAVLGLARSARSEFPSWLALKITKSVAEESITIGTPAYSAGEAQVRSSLRLDIGATVPDGRLHSIVLLAGERHAFDAFRHFRSVEPGDQETSIRRLVVDEDVPLTGWVASVAPIDPDTAGCGAAGSGAVGIGVGVGTTEDAEHAVEQAVGILLDRGWSDARGHLVEGAAASGRTLHEQARTVLASLAD
jgi:hypothetical protein